MKQICIGIDRRIANTAGCEQARCDEWPTGRRVCDGGWLARIDGHGCVQLGIIEAQSCGLEHVRRANGGLRASSVLWSTFGWRDRRQNSAAVYGPRYARPSQVMGAGQTMVGAVPPNTLTNWQAKQRDCTSSRRRAAARVGDLAHTSLQQRSTWQGRSRPWQVPTRES